MGDTDALARRLDELLADPDRCKAVAMRGGEAVRHAVDLVEAHSDLDDRVHLLDDLAFVRRPGALRAIRPYLDGDEVLRGSGHGVPGVAAHQVALHALAQHVPGFPVEPGFVGGYGAREVSVSTRGGGGQTETDATPYRGRQNRRARP